MISLVSQEKKTMTDLNMILIIFMKEKIPTSYEEACFINFKEARELTLFDLGPICSCNLLLS